MKLVQMNKNDVPFCFRPTKLFEILNEFVDSGMQCAKVIDHNYESTSSGAGSFNASAKRFGLSGKVKAISRKGEIYLIRKDAE